MAVSKLENVMHKLNYNVKQANEIYPGRRIVKKYLCFCHFCGFCASELLLLVVVLATEIHVFISR
jgi:hypothetical protein